MGLFSFSDSENSDSEPSEIISRIDSDKISLEQMSLVCLFS